MGGRSRLLTYFTELVVVDSEFRTRGNGTQEVRCVCALELGSGKAHRSWIDDDHSVCPYPTGGDKLFIAHYAVAELLTHDSLGWPRPTHILDTCVEFSAATAGVRRRDQGRTLVDALLYMNLPHLGQHEKDGMRALAMADRRNDEYAEDERQALLDYCWSDVVGTATLLGSLEACLCR